MRRFIRLLLVAITIASVFQPKAAYAVSTTGLISYWKLDEASGNAIDIHGSNNLTDNSVGAGTGKINGARDFDGSQWFNIGTNASLETGDIDFTVTAWVKADTLSATTNNYIGWKGDAVADLGEWGLLYQNFGSVDRFAFLTNNGNQIVTASSLGAPSAGVWYFIVAWHDSGADTINIQVNDGAVDSAPTGGASPGVSTTGFFMGAAFATGPGVFLYWDGLIDEFGFWKRTLTTQERTDLYNSNLGLAYPFSTGTPVFANPRQTLIFSEN